MRSAQKEEMEDTFKKGDPASVAVERDKAEIIKHAIELESVAVSGDWRLPRGMADAINAICDAVWELKEDLRLLDEAQQEERKCTH